MTIDAKDLLNSILASVARIDYVKPEDIPNIDLYMDFLPLSVGDTVLTIKIYPGHHSGCCLHTVHIAVPQQNNGREQQQ